MMNVDIISDITVLVCAACTLPNICSEHEDEIEQFLEYDDETDVGEYNSTHAGTSSGINARNRITRLISN